MSNPKDSIRFPSLAEERRAALFELLIQLSWAKSNLSPERYREVQNVFIRVYGFEPPLESSPEDLAEAAVDNSDYHCEPTEDQPERPKQTFEEFIEMATELIAENEERRK